jgi:glycosyltransferase involved in cell wall biosynthesis
MIVKNEEANLRTSLESVKDVVDEIVIVDTGSTDNTVKIAKEFGAKIFHFDWINDFSAARNFALKHSTGDWILYLDADERLEQRSKGELKRILSRDGLNGVNCLINNVDEITGTPKFMKYVRLFNNSGGIKFTGKVHEQIENSLVQNNYSISNSKIEIVHTGYNLDKVGLRKKAERNLNPLIEEYSCNPSSYYAFQLANTYKVLNDRKNEIKFHKIALQDPKLKSEYKAVGYLTLADYSLRENNVNLALEYVNLGLALNGNFPLLNLVASQVYNSLNEKSKAIEFCKKGLIENRLIRSHAESQNSIDVLLPEEKILKHGLYLSLSAANQYMFNYFLLELGGLENSDKYEVELIEKLYNNLELQDEELNYLGQKADVDSLDLYLLLIAGIESIQSQLNALFFFNDQFETSSKFLTRLGLSLYENSYNNEAAQVFERALKLEEKDPSQVFYLISIYVEENKYSEIPRLLEFAMTEFSHIAGIQKKIENVIKKLEPILIN